ncbi:unnamed protein product [Hymenolepis diminuta]|uniref:CACTA en-spm transposon protein n=1 Tax=Hymenolepis diminuta TaxID=6216 RepID=A0A0R3SR97_HYMDI|nr:unnamed protein product [Hymenolepis diminuta]
MLESLSAEIKVLSANIKAKMSSEESDTSTTTVSLNSYKNSTQSPVAPVSSKMLPTVTLVQAVDDDMKLLLSVCYRLNIKSKTDPMKIYLDACYLFPPWNPETPKIQSSHRRDRYSERFRKSQKRFKMEPTSRFMDQQLRSGGVE